MKNPIGPHPDINIRLIEPFNRAPSARDPDSEDMIHPTDLVVEDREQEDRNEFD